MAKARDAKKPETPGRVQASGFSATKTIAKAASLVLVTIMFSKIASYAFRWVGAKLGTAEYGKFSMAFGVFEVVTGLALLGVDTAVSRFVVDDALDRKKSAGFPNSFWYGVKVILFSSIAFAIALVLSSSWIASNVFHLPEIALPLALFGLTLPFFLLVLVFVSAARGLKHVEYEAGAKNVLESFLRPVIAFLAISMGLGILGISISVFASAVMVFLACCFWASRLFPHDWARSIMDSAKPPGFFHFSIPLYASNLLSILMVDSAVFSLGLMVGASEAGVFSALLPIAVFITMPSIVIIPLFISVCSELLALGRISESQALYQGLIKAILLFSLPLTVLIAFFSREALTFLYLVDYSQGALALSIVSVAYLVYSVFLPSIHYLFVIKRTDLMLANLIVSSLVVFAAIFLLVPSCGTAGAAAAFSLGLVVQVALCIVQVQRFAKLQPFSDTFARTLAAGLIAIVPLFLLNGAFGLRAIPRVLFGVAVYGLVYASLLFLLRALDSEDIELLKSAERKSGIKLGALRDVLKRVYFRKGK